MLMRALILALLALAVTLRPGHADPADGAGAQSPCKTVQHAASGFTVCTLPLARFDLSLHHARPDGTPWGQPAMLEAALRSEGRDVALLTNGGMYHKDRRPVGLYVEAGERLAPLVEGDGPGNFQLLPNGVFWIADGKVGVAQTQDFAEAGLSPDFATQSGPMLVIGGELHPAFREGSESRYRRSGIGVLDDGETAIFAISEAPVNFHDFATLFRDALGVSDALYLDGKVCRLDLPAEGRREPGLRMGPILVAAVRNDPED